MLSRNICFTCLLATSIIFTLLKEFFHTATLVLCRKDLFFSFDGPWKYFLYKAALTCFQSEWKRNKYLVALTSVAPWKNHFEFEEIMQGATFVNALHYLFLMQCLLKVFLYKAGYVCLLVLMQLHLETEQVKTSVAPWIIFFNNSCITKDLPESKFV